MQTYFDQEMNSVDFEQKAALAERAARAAGAMLEHGDGFQVKRKAENDFVTEMDFKSEAMIRDILLTACPEDEFFGEEMGGACTARGRWIVDPIDGTANFMHGYRLYTISIAYEYEGALCAGVVYCPGTDELFRASLGNGATCNGKPIHVSETTVARDTLVSLGFGHRNPALLERTLGVFPALIAGVSDVRRSGTAAYDLCCVAAGRTGAFIELGLNIYDYAAGCVIVKEAGGRITGWADGEDAVATGNLIASNGRLHETLRALVNG